MPFSLRLLSRAFVGLLLVAVAGCDTSDPTDADDPDAEFVTGTDVVVNPSGVAPLTARVAVTTSRPVSVAVTVEGRRGDRTDVHRRFDTVAQEHEIPVLGLYPATDNSVRLRFFAPDGRELGTQTVSIATAPLLPDLPDVEINQVTASAMKPGFHFVSYFGHNGAVTPQRPFVFDNAGDIRWYLDFSEHPTLSNLFYDNGMERLANGHLYFGNNNDNRIYEINMFGEIVNMWGMPGYSFHHNVIETPDGNFVATVSKEGAPTIEDYVIEIDRSSGEIVTVWNLNESLDNGRRAWETDLADLDVDWFHGNALAYDASDDAILVSGRTQGVVKLTESNEVVWILAPHEEWGTAGDGTELSPFLLQPLDAEGQPIPDDGVRSGAVNHPDFEWAWYQHAPALLPDGSLLLFDNGENRNYTRPGTYSRAVIYQIDEPARTIRQTWQYGKERGPETYSRIVSDVDYHADEDNVVFMPGAVTHDGASYGKVVEVDRASREVVFEATIDPPTAPFGITFHRVQRMGLYPAR